MSAKTPTSPRLLAGDGRGGRSGHRKCGDASDAPYQGYRTRAAYGAQRPKIGSSAEASADPTPKRPAPPGPQLGWAMMSTPVAPPALVSLPHSRRTLAQILADLDDGADLLEQFDRDGLGCHGVASRVRSAVERLQLAAAAAERAR